MDSLTVACQTLMSALSTLTPSAYQQDTLKALLGFFFKPIGRPLPEHCQAKSPAAISRFLNHYPWPTRELIRSIRAWVLSQLLSWIPAGGRRPQLQVILDLTTLEKTGKFRAFSGAVGWYNRKRGLHLVVMYLVVEPYRIRWNFRLYRGKGNLSPAQLALLSGLPKPLKHRYKVMVLADTGFGSKAFFQGLRRLKLDSLVGVTCNRRLTDGRLIKHLYHAGQQVFLDGLAFPLTMGYYLFKGEDGRYRKRYILSTRRLKASTLQWWGRRRWQIETFFKVIKHCFGQCTQLGVYRWLLLVLLAFVLALWSRLARPTEQLD